MKKLPSHTWLDAGPVRLTFDDIEALATLVGGGTSSGIRVRADGFELESVAELLSLNRHQLSWLSLENAARTVEVKLTDTRAHVWTSSDGPLEQGLATQLERFLQSKGRGPFPRRRNAAVLHLILPIVAMVLYFYLMTRISLGMNRATFILGLSYVAIIAFPHAWDRWFALPHSVLLLRRRVELPSFWERNRDAIVVNILICILSALVGFLVAKL